MVEVCFSPEHLDFHNLAAVREAASRIDHLGMEAYSFHAPFAREIDISSPSPARREFSVGEIFRAAEAASILGVHEMVIHPGPEEIEMSPPDERLERMEHVVAALDRVAIRCGELGIGCVLENKLPHLVFGKINDILWILDALETSQIGACLDTGHAALSGDLHLMVHKLAPHIRMIHAHDNNGRGDDHSPPGDGKINWQTFLRELTHVHFGGAIILEIAGGPDTVSTMANARRGRTCLRRFARRLALERIARFPEWTG